MATTRRSLAVVAAAVAGLVAAGCGDGGGGGGGDGGDSGARAAAQVPDGGADAAPSLTATGTGRASAAPDTMVVSLNVRTDGDSAAETMDTASLRTRQLLDTARQQGVADEDLQSTHVSVFPRFDEDGNRVVGYSADHTFTVRYRDLATAGALLDQLLGVGGNFVRLHGIAMEIDDPTAVLDEARADAVSRARAQAEQLAEAAGVELGEVRRVSEVPFGLPFAGEGAFTELAASRATADAAIPVPIAPGSQEVTVQVSVVFDIS